MRKGLTIISAAIVTALLMTGPVLAGARFTKTATGTGAGAISTAAIVTIPADAYAYTRVLAYSMTSDNATYNALVYGRATGANTKRASDGAGPSNTLIPITGASAYFAAEDYIVVQDASGATAEFHQVSSVSTTHVTTKNALTANLQGVRVWVYRMSQIGTVNVGAATVAASNAAGVLMSQRADSPLAIVLHASSASSINYITGDWL